MSGNNRERLSSMVGFDPAKHPQVTDDVFKKVMKDIKEERAEKAAEKAKGLLEQAFALSGQMAKAASDFKRQEKKFDKELGKLINRLESELKGGPPPVEEEAEADGQDETSDEA